MDKNFLFLAISFALINVTGCQHIQTAADSTVGAISKGVNAYDGWVSKGAQNRYDVDPAFVEFDKNGSPVAIMTRSWQTISAIGVDSRLYTNIYFAQDALRWFENNFSNRYLEDSLLRKYN